METPKLGVAFILRLDFMKNGSIEIGGCDIENESLPRKMDNLKIFRKVLLGCVIGLNMVP